MKVSLNWLRDYIDIPEGLDPRSLGGQFTMTTAEVEGIEQVRADSAGLNAAKILKVQKIDENLTAVRLKLKDRKVETVSAAKNLWPGQIVVYAPPGATLASEPIGEATVAGRPSVGMIAPSEALAMGEVKGEAVFLPPRTAVGSAIDPALFSDWIIDIDNKSLTHRPDLWGHYGIARELAAMLGLKLKKYPVTPIAKLQDESLPQVPIEIDDPMLCRRYCGLMMTGLKAQPAPLWMQVRLARVGMRPINLIVDLTNYVMADLAQPMHAFDGDKVDRIEVAVTKPADRFRTLDAVDRVMPAGALMIMSHRNPIALAGIMGGADTEVTETTEKLLLESANFDPACIRKTAGALGHRTEASARFEKSLDPEFTVLGIQRFHYLAARELPRMRLVSRLSDCYPTKMPPITVEVDLDYASRFMGQPVTFDQAKRVLERIAFKVSKGKNHSMVVKVPTFRATKDISIQADILEELARFIGYDNIRPELPRVTVRALEPDRMHHLQARSLAMMCEGRGYYEVHSYIWYDADWLKTINYQPNPTLELRNPAAAGQERLRREMAPNMLAFVDRNRHFFSDIRLAEIGSVFEPAAPGQDDAQYRHLTLARAGRGDEAALLKAVKADVETWVQQMTGRQVSYRQVAADKVLPWESPLQTVEVLADDRILGRVTVVPVECRLRIDQHLRRLGIVLAELRLNTIVDLDPPTTKLGRIPTFPEVELDFSVLTPAERHYAALADQLRAFSHPLLQRLWFVDSYEGAPIPAGQRSITLRARLGAAERTLTDDDLTAFRQAFVQYLETAGLKLR
jgi:phenylalanyl-tRNA synthetase beta chain